jgi:hypothetical protein
LNWAWNMQSNVFWQKNTSLFRERFPGLYAMHEGLFSGPPPSPPDDWELIAARNGAATVREGGAYLHSAYDPVQEAARLAASLVPPDHFSSHPPLVFLGFGLGYLPAASSKCWPDSPLVLIEPDLKRFALALSAVDWSGVLSRKVCMLLVGAGESAVVAALEQAGRLSEMVFAALPALTKHAASYFADLQTLIRRNVDKQNINDATLKRFGGLWKRNCRRNLPYLETLDGINTLANKGGILWPGRGERACVVGAGPTLEGILPELPAIRQKAVIIAVDTALRSCLDAGVEPDLIVLADGQYWNARHIAGLSSPNALLVTEICAYPSVFRFPCRQVILFDSANPVGAEYAAGFPKGCLGAGGSVASSAWDLARILGAAEIYLAGLDLGFPQKRTHARGSFFEKQSHRASTRIAPQEGAAVSALFSAPPVSAQDYDGNVLASDARMSLYDWWFESAIAYHPGCRTYSLCPASRAIPGVAVSRAL